MLTAPVRTPGARAPAMWSLMSRLGITMGTVALLIYLQALTGSIAVAAAVSAAVLIGESVGAVVQGRLVDRRGAVPTYLVDLVVFVPAAAGLFAAAERHAGSAALLAAGLLFGLTRPALTSPSRALWDHLLPTGHRTPGYTYEAVSMEVLFIVGPALAAGLATLRWPGAGLAVAVAVSLVGTAGFIATRAVRRWSVVARPGSDDDEAQALTVGLRTLLLLVFGFGLATGPVEVTAVAAATAAGTPALSGPMIGLWSVVSVLSGLAYARHPWPRPLHLRAPMLLVGFAVLVAAMGLPLLLLSPWPALVGLAVMMAVAGTLITPQCTGHSLLVEVTVPPAAAGEAFGWVITAVTLGLAAGQLGSGAVIATVGLAGPVVMGGTGGMLLAAGAWHRRRSLIGSKKHEPEGQAARPWEV